MLSVRLTMRQALATISALILCCSFASFATAGDAVHYLSCRADNEDTPSLVGIDETTKKVCDREFSSQWLAPLEFDGAKIEWGDGGGSTKSITHNRKGSRYEHDTYFVLVHIGHCNKAKAPSVEPCKG
jgi:hypothetical protein